MLNYSKQLLKTLSSRKSIKNPEYQVLDTRPWNYYTTSIAAAMEYR